VGLIRETPLVSQFAKSNPSGPSRLTGLQPSPHIGTVEVLHVHTADRTSHGERIASRRTMDPLADHFKIEAEVLPDRTRQISYVADRIRGLRRVQIVEEWVRKERLGTGASGSVFLEERVNDKQLRAVKEVRRSGEIKDYLELVAMARLSKVSYCGGLHLCT
jgi:hypothetical protein